MATSTTTGSLILKVDSTEANKGAEALDKLTVSAQGASDSVDKLAESEDQAKARIKAMVQASMEKVRAQNESIASGQREVQMTDAQRAAVEKLNKSSNTQADMNARGAALLAAEDRARKAATVGIADQTAGLAALIGKIDPSVAALERLDGMQAKLAAFKKSGAISGEDFAVYSAKIEQARGEIGKASAGMHTFSLNSAMARRELGRMGTDIAQGNFGRLSQTSMTLANYTGVMGLAFSAAGAAILGTAAVVGAFIAAAAKGWAESEKLRTTLIATGNAAGVSATQLDAMAKGVGDATGQYGDARKAIELLAASGKVAGAGMSGLAQQAVNMSKVTGDSIDKSVSKIIELSERPTETIAKLNEQYHVLTSSQYAQIAALEAEGKVREASRLANQIDAQAMKDRAKDVDDNAGIMIRAGHAVSEAWGKAWDAMKGVGRTAGLGEQADALQKQIDNLTGVHFVGSVAMPGISKDDPRVQALQKQLAEVRAQQYQSGLKGVNDSIDAQANADAVAAQKRLSAFMAPSDTRDNAIKKANADRLAALYGIVDPVERARINAQAEKQIADANKAYESATKAPRSGRGAKAADLSINVTDDYLTKVTEGYRKQLTAQANATLGVQQYGAALDKQNDALQRTIQSQIDKIGMGDKEYAQQQQINELYVKGAEAMTQLQLKRASVAAKGGDTSELDQDIALLQANTGKQVAIVTEGYRRMDAARSDWTNGLRSSLANYLDQAGDVAGQSATLFTNAFNGMSDSLANFATTGKMNFKGLVASILTDLAKMEMRIAMSKILQQVVGMFMGGSGTDYNSTTGTGGYLGGNGTGGYGMQLQSAKGNVFNTPSLSAYSNTIVDRPTFFAKGGNVMGEAGPEAIMPLKRGSDGTLGVRMHGGGGDTIINTSVTVDSNGNSQSQTDGGNSEAARQLGKIIETKVREVMTSESRQGGQLWRMQHE